MRVRVGGVPWVELAASVVQHHLEELAKRKVDMGFLDSFRPQVLSAITPDL
jgi:hypothetical protein